MFTLTLPSFSLVMFAILCGIITILPSQSSAVRFTDCNTPGKANIRHVLIEGCDSEGGVSLLSPGQPCLLSRGRDLWLRTKFVPHDNYAEVKTDIRAKIGFFERPIADAIDEDACERYLKCPLVKSEPQWINTTFNVPTSVPKAGVTVTLKLLSPAPNTGVNRLVMCAQTKVQID